MGWLLCSTLLGQEAPSLVPAPDEALVMAGFGDVNFSSRDEAGRSGFELGALDLYLTSELSSRWSALAELVFENNAGVLATDLERITLAFEPSSHIKLTAGRLQGPEAWRVLEARHGRSFDRRLFRSERVVAVVEQGTVKNLEDVAKVRAIDGKLPGQAGYPLAW